MPETYLDKLAGRTIDAAFCSTCLAFVPIMLDHSTTLACPHCGMARNRCVITIERGET